MRLITITIGKQPVTRHGQRKDMNENKQSKQNNAAHIQNTSGEEFSLPVALHKVFSSRAQGRELLQ